MAWRSINNPWMDLPYVPDFLRCSSIPQNLWCNHHAASDGLRNSQRRYRTFLEKDRKVLFLTYWKKTFLKPYNWMFGLQFSAKSESFQWSFKNTPPLFTYTCPTGIAEVNLVSILPCSIVIPAGKRHNFMHWFPLSGAYSQQVTVGVGGRQSSFIFVA